MSSSYSHRIKIELWPPFIWSENDATKNVLLTTHVGCNKILQKKKKQKKTGEKTFTFSFGWQKHKKKSVKISENETIIYDQLHS